MRCAIVPAEVAGSAGVKEGALGALEQAERPGASSKAKKNGSERAFHRKLLCQATVSIPPSPRRFPKMRETTLTSPPEAAFLAVMRWRVLRA